MFANFVEEKVSPILVHLMDVTNLDDFRIEAVQVSNIFALFYIFQNFVCSMHDIRVEKSLHNPRILERHG